MDGSFVADQELVENPLRCVSLAADRNPAPALGEQQQTQANQAANVQHSHSTPQMAQQATVDMTQHVTQQVAGQMARTASSHALGLLRKGAGEIRVYIEKNHYSIHVLSFCGGIALSVSSLAGLLNVFGALTGLLSYILHFYQFCFGLVICAIDGPVDKMPRVQAAVIQYAPLLHNNTGRSLFYLFIACLEGSQELGIHWLVGWYFLGISVMHIALKCKSLAGGSPAPDEKTDVLLPGP